MLILVKSAVDGEHFILNTAFIRSFHPARNPQFPTAMTVAICHDEAEGPFWLTESVVAIDCLSRGEHYVEVDIDDMRNQINAAIAARNNGSTE
ncbi:hypothetical protein [Pontitalea aquivivens]|uniref:hypothetical protein n=1 Tax=Pontitalea aquivivens TaxID=3388663 RepID=UPI003970CA22